MTPTEIISRTETYVKHALVNAEAGHDWFHTQRVWKNALHILLMEEADELVVSLACLLHDIADAKFHDGDEEVGPQTAEAFLQTLPLSPGTVNHVVAIVRHMSFKAGKDIPQFYSKEMSIVQDADRLDAIGAIGVARAFHYGGFKNRKMYDPDVPPDLQMDKETYKKSTAPTLNHFYEKLLLLKNTMNTAAGKQMAEERHKFLEDFLHQFLAEWNGQR